MRKAKRRLRAKTLAQVLASLFGILPLSALADGAAGGAATKMPPATPDPEPLVKMKSLLGNWTADMGKNKMSASYKLTGGGKCVSETFKPNPKTEMMTVYCADGPGMVVTHFCDGGSQPRMRTKGVSSDGKTLDFAFLDITNLPAPNAPHMRSVKITFQDETHFVQEWTSKDGDKETPMKFTWTKTK